MIQLEFLLCIFVMAVAAFCYRHPAQSARRNCFQCRHSFCQNCLLKLDHHLFCGNRCHQAYLLELALETKPSIGRYAIYSGLLLSFAALVYFGLLADAFYTGGNRPAANIRSIALSLPVNVEEKAASAITISSPLNGERITAQKIQIQGIAPENSEVTLYLNGTPLDKTIARAGRYRFASVGLSERANVVQTRYYVQGSSEASTAIMVFHDKSTY